VALGDILLEAARTTRVDACLIAPFVKTEVIERIFAALSEDVRVNVITRWIPAEIAAGVNDLEVFDVVSARSGAKLFLNGMLHAKLYRFDRTYRLGSANLTGKALGWRAPSNIEILRPADGRDDDLRRLEETLLSSSMLADARYREEVRRQVDLLVQSGFDPRPLAAEIGGLPASWLPTCPSPEKLWDVYSDPENARRRMVESAFDAAGADIACLQVGDGLSEIQFYRVMSGALNQMPLVRLIEREAETGLNAEKAAALIAAAGGAAPYATTEMWEILAAWLQYYFPDRYRMEPMGEVLRYGRIFG
jgi:phospholipase D-like protein